MEWAQVGTIVGAFTAVIGLQTFWISRSLDALRSEMYRGFDRVEARLDRLEGRVAHLEGREPPTLRRA